MDGAGQPLPLTEEKAQSGTVCTTCPYCGVGCGVLARSNGRGEITIKGDKAHPANEGRLCSKGSALGETTDLDDRLLAPVVNGAEADWDSALDLVAERFQATIAEHGPDSALAISTPIPGFAWPLPWRGTSGPLALIRCPASTPIWTRPM